MERKLLVLACIAALAAPVASAHAARGRVGLIFPRGDLVVTFSGTGGGGYRYHVPPVSTSGGSCRVPDTAYAETDAYNWSFTFVVAPGGGTSQDPVALGGGGLLSASQQQAQCGGTAAAASTCTQPLRTPPPAASGQLAYPNVSVVLSGRQITVGALGELIRTPAGPTCSGLATLIPNRVQGYSELQASVSFSRALLRRTGDAKASFTMAGSGLYSGVALSGSCNSVGCDPTSCAQALPAGGVAPATCSFTEGYSGTIDVRVVR